MSFYPCVIQALPQRPGHARYLSQHLSTPIVVWESATDPNLWATYRRTLLATDGAAHLHFEDDTTLTTDFESKASRVIGNGEVVVQFYSHFGDDPERGPRKMSPGSWGFNNCFFLPEGYGPALAAFTRRSPKYHLGRMDTILSDWLRAEGLSYWLHVPSLVQTDDVKSLRIGRRQVGRYSRTFTSPELRGHPCPEAVIVCSR